MASDVANRAASKDSALTITVVVRRLPEGVWLATSDDLPGLIVETETRDEAIDLSPELALELLSENGERSDRPRPRFVFAFPVVSVVDGKAAVVVSVSDDLKGSVDAVELVRAEVVELGGKGGGGRPDFAQGGGPDGTRAAAALAAIQRALASQPAAAE